MKEKSRQWKTKKLNRTSDKEVNMKDRSNKRPKKRKKVRVIASELEQSKIDDANQMECAKVNRGHEKTRGGIGMK